MSNKEREGVSSACPHCRARTIGTSQLVGKHVVCPKCGKRFQFGEAPSATAPSDPSVCHACGGPVDWDGRRPRATTVTTSISFWVLRLLRHESHVLDSDPDGKTLRSVVAKDAGRSAATPICKHCLELFDPDLKDPGPTATAGGPSSAEPCPSAEDRSLAAAAEAWEILQGRPPEGFAPVGSQAGATAAESEEPKTKPGLVSDAFDFLAAEEADKQEKAAKRTAPKPAPKFFLRCFRCDQQVGCDSSKPRGAPCPSCHSRLTVVVKPEETERLRLADVAVRLAEGLGKREDWETAVSILRRARNLRSDHPMVLVRLGESLIALFRQKDARGSLASALGALDPATAFSVLAGMVKDVPAEAKSALALLPEAEARIKEANELFEGFHRAEQMGGELEELRGKRLPELMATMRASAVAAIRKAPAATCAFCKKAIEKPVLVQLQRDMMPVWVCKQCEQPFRKEVRQVVPDLLGGTAEDTFRKLKQRGLLP